MASKYDELDARTELEQECARDLEAAFGRRDCEVVHRGSRDGEWHAPGGVADIEIRDPNASRLVLVEVTHRKNAQADSEFGAVTDHLRSAIAAGGYEDYGLLYVSPSTSARMSTNFRDLWNRPRERDGDPGRIVAMDFEAFEMMTSKLAEAGSEMYPPDRLGDLLDRWDEAVDDSRTRWLVQQTLFPEDIKLAAALEEEIAEADADRENRLKKQLEKVEDKLRDYGITGAKANETLIYLTFARLYEERRQRLTSQRNRFTLAGFKDFKERSPQTVRSRYERRMAAALLHEIAEDPELREAGLLRDDEGDVQGLDDRLTDQFVEQNILPVFDEYDFHTGRVDVLGAVFETLARKAEKDTRIGQFFTPQPVVDFAVNMVPLSPRDVVLDPAVGTARFLIRAMKVMLAGADDGVEAQDEAERAIRAQRLIGTDIDRWVATIAKMNMYIHGDGKTHIQSENGLILADHPGLGPDGDGLRDKVGVVLTNPPLGNTDVEVAAQHWAARDTDGRSGKEMDFIERLGVVPIRAVEEDKLEVERARVEESHELISELESRLPDLGAKRKLQTARTTLRRRMTRLTQLESQVRQGDVTKEATVTALKGGALFLGAIADYLQPVRSPNELLEWRGGWAAIVVDEAILTTAEYADTRRFIRDHYYVKAVVSLDRGAFEYLAHTSAKTSLLFLTRKPEAGVLQREPVFYAHADRVGYDGKGRWIGDDLPQIELLYNQFRRTLKGHYDGPHFGREAALAAIRELPGYAVSFFAGENAGQEGERLDFYRARFDERVTRLRQSQTDMCALGDLVSVVEGLPPAPDRRGEYEFATVSRVHRRVESKGAQTVSYSPSQMWVVSQGDILVSGIDAVGGAVAVVGEDTDGLVVSKEYFGLRVKDEVDVLPEFVQILLQSRPALELLAGMSTGTSNRTRLEGPEQLLSLPVPVPPPLEGQEQQVERLRAAYDALREHERRIGELDAYSEGTWNLPPQREPLDPRDIPVVDATVA